MAEVLEVAPEVAGRGALMESLNAVISIMIMMIMMMMVMMMMMLMKTIFNILDATADVISQLQPGIFPLHTFYHFSY